MSWLLAFIGFAVLIILHEMGHFFAAKAVGMRVERFALFFPPLIAKRKRFVLPATIFFLSWYFGFILLAGYAEDFMGDSVYEGLTVGYCYALTQFLMVFVLGIWYLRKADREFDPLSDAVVQAAADAEPDTRFDRADGSRMEVSR